MPSGTMVPEEEERAREFANSRLRYLGCIQCLAVTLLVFSLGSISVGTAAVLKTHPYYYFPYVSGTGAGQGLFCFICGLMGMYIVSEGKKTPNHPQAMTTCCLRCLVGFLHCVGGFTVVACMLGLAISGIWAVAECNRDASEAVLARDKLNRCLPEKNVNLALGAAIIALSSVSLICVLVLWCTVICNSRSFGFVPNYAEYQSDRICDLEAEVQELNVTERSGRDRGGRHDEYWERRLDDYHDRDDRDYGLSDTDRGGGDRDGRSGNYRPHDRYGNDNRQRGQHSNRNQYGHGSIPDRRDRGRRGHREPRSQSDDENNRRSRDRYSPQPSAPPDPSTGASGQSDDRYNQDDDLPPSYSDAIRQGMQR